MPTISKDCKKIAYDCRDIFHIIENKEKYYQIYPLSKEPFFHLAQATKEWLLGTEFSKLTRFTDTDEGEIIRYFRMAVQLLREISVSSYVSFNLSRKAIEVLKLLNRGIVDAEKQLRS